MASADAGSGVVHDQVDPGQLAEREQLRCGVGGLPRPAATEHDHLAHRRGPQRCQRVVGDVGARQLVGIGAEDPGDVEGHVAGADDDGALRRSAGRRPAGTSGWALYQPTNSGPACTPGRSSPGHLEPPSGGGADRVDDGVEVLGQLVDRHVLADLDAEQHAAPADGCRAVPGSAPIRLVLGWSGATP